LTIALCRLDGGECRRRRYLGTRPFHPGASGCGRPPRLYLRGPFDDVVEPHVFDHDCAYAKDAREHQHLRREEQSKLGRDGTTVVESRRHSPQRSE
jgi:hypothetical protein